jgi:beta-lactamase class A
MTKDDGFALARHAVLFAIPAAAAAPALARLPERQSLPPAITAYERRTGGRVGVHAENLVSGAKLQWRADERFVMCSTFKASLAALVLSRVDRGLDRLERGIRFGPADIVGDWWAPVAKANLAKGVLTVSEMCAAAVEYSDNTCANLLLAQVGGPSALTSFWRSMGDKVTRLDHNEPMLNRSRPGNPQDTTTPRAMAGTLRRLALGNALSEKSRGLLVDWMLGCKTGDNRLRGGVPKGWRVANKTGNNGDDAAGDIALIWPRPAVPVVVAVYTQGGSPTPPQLEILFAEIGRALGTRMA